MNVHVFMHKAGVSLATQGWILGQMAVLRIGKVSRHGLPM